MQFSDKESKLIRLGLNHSAQGNEIETSAIMLFRSLRERGVSAETILFGNGKDNNQAQAELDRALRAEMVRNMDLRSEVNALRARIADLNKKLDAERAERAKHEPKAEPKRNFGGGGSFVPNEEQISQKAKWEKVAREWDGELEDFIFLFGKFKGVALKNTSYRWLKWAISSVGLTDMPETVEIIEDYLANL